ncbi:Vegetative incompatibility protein HET-E-1 [Colletotrichum siamense]|nr:Vegetative incompatibility protein HET-E-1 [Colletotrichum siamense]
MNLNNTSSGKQYNNVGSGSQYNAENITIRKFTHPPAKQTSLIKCKDYAANDLGDNHRQFLIDLKPSDPHLDKERIERTKGSLLKDSCLLSDQSYKRPDTEETARLHDQRADCLKLLYTCPYLDRKDINPERVDGTCEWFIRHPYFLDWKESLESKLLWVSADPGCGKSVLAKYLVDNILISDLAQTTCYFFFKENFSDQKTAVAALCALLRQLFIQQPQLLSTSIIAQFRSDGKTLTESFSSLFEMLIKVVAQSSTQIICLIDALDECQEGDRQQLITALSKLYNDSTTLEHPLKFILTSRPYLQIQRGFRRLENSWPTIHLRGEDDTQVTKIAQEIDVFAKSRIHDISETLSLEGWETKFLEEQFMKTENRTYLWVKVALDVIENILSFTEDSVKDALRTIPESLDKLYENILNRSLDVEKAHKLLHIVISAARPLTLQEISVALAVSESHQSYSDIQMEPSERFKDTLRATCGLFVTVVEGKVYFLHQTAKEFLVNLHNDQVASEYRTVFDNNTTTVAFTWKHAFSLQESHAIFAKICMGYLALRYIHHCETRGNMEEHVESHDYFFHYAASYWHEHFREASFGMEDGMTDLAVKLCQCCHDEDSLESWFLTYLSTKYFYRSHLWKTVMEPPTHHAYLPSDKSIAFCKRYYVAGELTPLIIAAACGLETVVQRILHDQTSAQYDLDGLGRTVLWWAAAEGHAAVVRLLLSQRGDEDFYEFSLNGLQDGQTPLMMSCIVGHESTVRAFLEDLRLSPNIENEWSDALHYAVRYRHEGIANMLLDDDRTLPKMTEAQKWRFLKASLAQRYSDMTQVAVRAMDPNYTDAEGNTAFTLAIHNIENAPGESVLPQVKAIHAVGIVDPSTPDKDHRTPVWWAAKTEGADDVLEYLLTDLDLNPNLEIQAVRYTSSPLSCSAQSGSTRKVKALLNTGKVDINSNDNNPLMYVIKAGNTSDCARTCGLQGPRCACCEAVSILLAHGADPNMRHYNRMTALILASEEGMDGICKLLIDNGALIDAQNDLGLSPLMKSAEQGHASTVKLLLSSGASFDLRDNKGQTALHISVREGCLGVVQILLEAGADRTARDMMGNTPLDLASRPRLHDRSHRKRRYVLPVHQRTWEYLREEEGIRHLFGLSAKSTSHQSDPEIMESVFFRPGSADSDQSLPFWLVRL